MAIKIDPKDLAATWIIEAERAGSTGLIGMAVRIEIQQVNPMLRRAVITPVSSKETHDGVFGRIKPAVVTIQNDMLLCSLGIMARRKP